MVRLAGKRRVVMLAGLTRKLERAFGRPAGNAKANVAMNQGVWTRLFVLNTFLFDDDRSGMSGRAHVGFLVE